MSALNVFIRPHAAYIVSDGLAANETCRSPFSKVSIFPHLRAAIVSRGHVNIVAGLGCFINYTRPSFEAAAQSFADDVRNVQAHLRPSLEGSADIQAALVGWAEAGDAPAGLFVDSTAAEPCEATFFGSVVPPAVAPIPFATRADAVALIAAQRAAYPEQVGGFVELTTIRRDRIISEILHRWPEDFSS